MRGGLERWRHVGRGGFWGRSYTLSVTFTFGVHVFEVVEVGAGLEGSLEDDHGGIGIYCILFFFMH